jgi:hypothetical protein
MDVFDAYAEEVYQHMINEKHFNALKYGKIAIDLQSEENGNYYRLRIILWDDMVYADWMRNGIVIFCEPISDKKSYNERIELSNWNLT